MAKIVYRVVCGLISLAVIPIAVFVPLIRFVGDVSLLDSYVGESVSLWDIYRLFFAKGSTFSGFAEGATLTDEIRALLPSLIASGVCFAIVLILSLVILGFAAFSNKKIVITSLSGAAIIMLIATFITFGNFAEPFTSGAIGIADLGLIESGILSSIAGSFFSIKIIQITSAGFLIGIAYGAILLWSLSFILTEIGEPKTKKK